MFYGHGTMYPPMRLENHLTKQICCATEIVDLFSQNHVLYIFNIAGPGTFQYIHSEGILQ